MSFAGSDLSNLVEQMTANLRDSSKGQPIGAACDIAREFLERFFRFGLALEREPELRDTPAVKRFLDGASGLLPGVMPGFFSAVDRFDGRLHMPGDLDWRQVGKFRSSLEFFTAYFGQSPEFELEDVDAAIRERAQYDGGISAESIPHGIPKSHWWWFAP